MMDAESVRSEYRVAFQYPQLVTQFNATQQQALFIEFLSMHEPVESMLDQPDQCFTCRVEWPCPAIRAWWPEIHTALLAQDAVQHIIKAARKGAPDQQAHIESLQRKLAQRGERIKELETALLAIANKPKVGDTRTNDPEWLDKLPDNTVIAETRTLGQTIIWQKVGSGWHETGDNDHISSDYVANNSICTIIWLPEEQDTHE